MKHKEQIGLYVHIPFCLRKCDYCDFLSFPADRGTQEDYVNALCKQIDAAGDERPVASVYFGGGTPSVLDAAWIETILCKLKSRFEIPEDAEITIEVNPKTADREKLQRYFDIGINRLSIGLQSVNDDELKLLGRIHSYDDFLNTIRNAADAGFQNINVDLITALPGQDDAKLLTSLLSVCELEPKVQHISAYSLIIEEGTPFFDRYGNDRGALPDEDQERHLYALCRDTLASYGYVQYEISNFACPGFESRHNSSYWKRQDYLGFGLGAASLYRGRRFCGCKKMEDYLTDPCRHEEEVLLSKEECMEEFMFLGLRMLSGVSEQDFLEAFQIPLTDLYADVIQKLCKQGLLERESGRIFLTPKGIDYGNYVFSCFLL